MLFFRASCYHDMIFAKMNRSINAWSGFINFHLAYDLLISTIYYEVKRTTFISGAIAGNSNGTCAETCYKVSNATQLQWSCWTFSSRNWIEYIVFVPVALKILHGIFIAPYLFYDPIYNIFLFLYGSQLRTNQ